MGVVVKSIIDTIYNVLLFWFIFPLVWSLTASRFPGVFTIPPLRKGIGGVRQMCQMERVRNTQFGPNCGRLPDAFRLDKQSGICHRHRLSFLCIEKGTESEMVTETKREDFVVTQIPTHSLYIPDIPLFNVLQHSYLACIFTAEIIQRYSND